MKDKLTIIIPTHNRPALIARALDYYQSWNCVVVVCDSSDEPPQELGLPNVQVLYCPELSFDRKLYLAAKNINTPYVCISADDDFLVESGVEAGISFLEQHDDYVSVQGHYIEFGWIMGELDIGPSYLNSIGLDINSMLAEDRIVRAMSPYMPQIMAVCRSDVLEKALAISASYNSFQLAEFSTALVEMVFGKHKVIPVFWMARDAGIYTVYNSDPNSISAIVPDLGRYLDSVDGIAYKARFSEVYALHLGKPVSSGENVFDNAFLKYREQNNDRSNSDLLSNLRKYVKRLIPVFILRWRRWCILRGIIPHGYPLHPGYPWSDPTARIEWGRIRHIIMKHRLQVASINDKRLF